MTDLDEKLREMTAPYCTDLGYSWAYLEPLVHAAAAIGAAQRQADLIEWLQTRFNANQIEELAIDRAIGEIESGAWKAP